MSESLLTLLSTLLGGVLTIVGGFVANYYIQTNTDKTNKKKEIRNLLEKVFKSTQNIDVMYERFFNKTINDKELVNILHQEVNNILFISRFYLNPLEKEAQEYLTSVAKNTDTLARLERHEIKLETCIQEIRKENNISQEKFRAAITKLLNKKGYRYF